MRFILWGFGQDQDFTPDYVLIRSEKKWKSIGGAKNVYQDDIPCINIMYTERCLVWNINLYSVTLLTYYYYLYFVTPVLSLSDSAHDPAKF